MLTGEMTLTLRIKKEEGRGLNASINIKTKCTDTNSSKLVNEKRYLLKSWTVAEKDSIKEQVVTDIQNESVVLELNTVNN